MSDRIIEVHGLACDWPGCDMVSDNFNNQYGETYHEAVENYTDDGMFIPEWLHVEPDRDYCYRHFHRSDDGELVPGPKETNKSK